MYANHKIFSGRNLSTNAKHLWRDFFTMVELKVSMRQQNDTSFSEMLNCICKGEHTNKEVKATQGRLESNGDIELTDALFDTVLRQTKLYTFEAEHVILPSRG